MATGCNTTSGLERRWQKKVLPLDFSILATEALLKSKPMTEPKIATQSQRRHELLCMRLYFEVTLSVLRKPTETPGKLCPQPVRDHLQLILTIDER